MRYYILLVAFLLSPIVVSSQNLEVAGKTKIATMDKDNAADSIVVRLSDGTLGVRDVSSLTEFQILSISNDTIYLTNSGYVVLPDADSTNEKISSLIIIDDSLSVSEGNMTMKVKVDSSNTNEKISSISIVGDSLSIVEGPMTMRLPMDSSNINELQEFSVSEIGDTLYLSGGNWVIVPGVSDANSPIPPDGTPCNDLDLCTENDQYISGVCQGTPKVCDDGNPCTIDSCDPTTGGCIFTPMNGPCDDGDPCTTNDTCNGGVCQGTPKVCDDGNPCTIDSCDPATGGCIFTPITGDLCPDGTCQNGVCVSNN